MSRYDGQSWTYITNEALTETWTYSAFVDRDGYLWLATFEGVIRYDPRIKPGAGSSSAEPAWTVFSRDDVGGTVSAILQDRDGHLWFGLNGYYDYYGGTVGHVGVSRYDGHTWETFSTEDGLSDNRVIAILEDRDGNLWFGTQEGVTVYDGMTWKTLTTRDGLAGNRIESICQDRQGDLWFGTFGSGVSRLTRSTPSRQGSHRPSSFRANSGGSGQARKALSSGQAGSEQDVWVTYTTKDGLADNRVLSICQDREGHLWFGTDGGVSRYSGYTFTTFTTADGLPSSRAYSALRDREAQLWFTTAGGLTRYDGLTFTTPNQHDRSVAAPKLFQDRGGDLWMTSMRQGLSRYDGVTFTTYTDEDGLGATGCRGGSLIQQDRNGNLWFGTYGGVSRYDGRNFDTFTIEDGLPENSYQVQSILQDRRNTLWIGTNAGLSQYEPDPDPGQVAFTAVDALAGKEVWMSFEDRDGNLWFGTWGDGVVRYDGRDFTMLGTEDGLAHNAVLSIVEDRRGHLWFGTDGGLVSRFDGQVFQTLTREDGLTGQAVRGMYADDNGDIWMMTLAGIVRYREPDPYPPDVFVDALVADRRYEDPADVAISSEVTLTAFEFHGISLKTRPGAMVFRYRLNGYDEDWRTTREQRIEYQDLPLGDYTFEVEAVDRDLVYSETPALVALTVHIPYGRMGLWSGLGVAILLIGWQTARVVRRDRRLREGNQALSDANKELFQVNVDLESVNVDLQREQVLERLRGQAQGMQSSEDIGPVVEAVYGELTGLGLPLMSTAFAISSETEVEHWTTGEDGRAREPYITQVGSGGADGEVLREARRRGDPYFHIHREGEETKDALRRAIERGNPRWAGVPEERWPQKSDTYGVFFDSGGVFLLSETPIDEEFLMLIRRFGLVFEYAHSRHKELRQKEAQNRRLAVEASIQRLRPKCSRWTRRATLNASCPY